MARNARRPEPKATLTDYAGAMIDKVGQSAANNPMATGGTVAFTVVMFFVTTNALFYQPHEHKDAFFQTRSMQGYKAPDYPKTSLKMPNTGGKTETFVITRSNDSEGETAPDPQLVNVQAALANLKLYAGEIDGLQGPKTRHAIASFQQQAGLEPTGEVNTLLIDAIKTASIPVKNVPLPQKKQIKGQAEQNTELLNTTSQLSQNDIKKLQAGLKAFGNDSIEIDGKVGGKTKEAILEFQGLFKLPKTGLADRETLDKLTEIGLVAG